MRHALLSFTVFLFNILLDEPEGSSHNGCSCAGGSDVDRLRSAANADTGDDGSAQMIWELVALRAPPRNRLP